MNNALPKVEDSPLDALKTQTLMLHKALEKRLAFPDSFASLDSYAKVLILFHRFQCDLALYSQRYRHDIDSQFHLTERNRLPLIEEDIQQLAVGLNDLPEAYQPLQLQSLDEFYGCLYVNEGSTLGGNVIQAAMLKMHGPVALDWTHYLNPYGEQMMPMWQQFRTALQQQLFDGKVTLPGVITGASKTFQFLLDNAADLGFADKR